MATDNTDFPGSSSVRRAGETERDRVQTDHHNQRPGRYANEGKVDPTHPGPKVGKKRTRR